MKNKTKHTPGPWLTTTDLDQYELFGYSLIAEDSLLAVISDEENATLIAAAPEMLEALEYLLEHAKITDLLTSEHSINKAKTAIKKAKGET